MEPQIAKNLSEAFVRRGHPRLDFRTAEGRRCAMRFAPYLSNFVRMGIRAVDLGCGTGKSTYMLSELGAHVTGIDVSFSTLKFAVEIGRSINASVSHIMGDYAQLPLRSRCCDLAFFPHNVVECSPEEFRSVTKETYRILTDHGLFVITVSNKWDKGKPNCKPICENGTVEIVGLGRYDYPSYSWSAEEIARVVQEVFSLFKKVPMLEQNSVMLVFHKK